MLSQSVIPSLPCKLNDAKAVRDKKSKKMGEDIVACSNPFVGNFAFKHSEQTRV